MKKALALLILALATLPSLASVQRIWPQYRIGAAELQSNDGRLTVSQMQSNEAYVADTSPLLTTCTVAVARIPAGQQFTRWWYYYLTGTGWSQVATTNETALGTATTCTWTYDSKIATAGAGGVYIVADFDYLTYTLTYNGNGGSGTAPSASNNIVYTNNVTIATNTFSRTGYTFGGWTNSLLSTVWWGGETVTGETLGLRSTVDGSAVVLRAKWTANTYTVTFNANGGSGSMANQSFTYGEAQNLSANTFTRTGYAFAGWATCSDGDRQYTDCQSVSNLTATNNDTVTLYAKWSLVYHSLAASATGTGSGTVSLNPSGGSYAYGTQVVVTATPATGSTFTGWSDGATANPRTYTMTGDVSVSAVFTAQSYTVTFEDYDGAILLSQNCNWGDPMPCPASNPSRTGYRFLGWSPTPPETVKNTATYYANYEANKYTVRFHANDGGDAATVKEQEFSYGTSQSLTLVSVLRFAKTGYVFASWKASDETTYQDGEEVLNLATGGTVDLNAVWSPIKYSIEFDGNGAESGSVNPIAAEYDTVYSLPGNGFVRSGFDFKGWLLDSATYVVGDSVSNLTTTADATVTFSAVWSEQRYIAFDGHGADDADAMAADTMTFDGVETQSLVSNKFEKTGYTFAGWATNETEAVALNAPYADGADVVSTNLWGRIGETNVLYAVWQTNAYTVVFNANGGTGEMEPQPFVYDVPQALATCDFTSNLIFAGWATNETDNAVFADSAVVSNLTAQADGTVTLYAVWDNGELSRAMHCSNLVWVQKETGADWTTVTGADEGYNHSGSSVSSSVSFSESVSTTQKLAPREGTTGSGKLSFRYKATQDGTDPYWFYFESDNDKEPRPLDLQQEWRQFGPVDVAELSTVAIYLRLNIEQGDDCTVYIDQMTWTPAGSAVEPTEADKPTIAAFAATTAGGFTLSVDPANISDSFTYQIVATNELVGGEWPVKTNLTAEAIKAGCDIVPEASEPTMFYKVKVIAK